VGYYWRGFTLFKKGIREEIIGAKRRFKLLGRGLGFPRLTKRY